MKHKKYIFITIILAAASALLSVSCRPADYSQVTAEDQQSIKDYIISTFYMEKPADAAAPRATVPVHTIGPLTFAGGIVYDYSETGQITTYTVAAPIADLYRISSVTTYPFNAALTNTTEEYYIKDVSVLGSWTNADPVVTGAGAVDNTYRLKFETAYLDGTLRSYRIGTDTSTNNWQGVKYTAFDINGSMDFPTVDVAPAVDGVALYSSKVDYLQDVNKKFSMWGRKYIALVGTQYYTEHLDPVLLDPAKPIKTFVAYERVVDAGASVKGKSIAQLEKFLWGAADVDLAAVTLATTVIRYQITADGTKTLKQRTVIFNDFGANFVYEASDGTEPVLAPYIPL